MCDVSGLMSGSRCYVAMHDSVGYPYDLACVDRATGKVLWKSKVFGTWWNGATGQHSTYVTVTEQDNRIIVFGAGSTGAHVEGFRAEDGKNLFRFSTSY
jgi:outer membrane protein assembly factor BamB